MDTYETVGYTALGVVVVLYLLAVLFGIIALFPFGLIGLIVVVGIGALFMKVVKERLANKEDDYYSKNVDK